MILRRIMEHVKAQNWGRIQAITEMIVAEKSGLHAGPGPDRGGDADSTIWWCA